MQSHSPRIRCCVPCAGRISVLFAGAIVGLSLSACEAPLDMSQVDAQSEKPVHRTDDFLSAVNAGDSVIMVGLDGVVVKLVDGAPVARTVLTYDKGIERPALVAVDQCPDGSLVALDAHRFVWMAPGSDGPWTSKPVTSSEDLMSLDCSQGGDYWIAASFGTILKSSDHGDSWTEFSTGDDLILTTVKFTSADTGYAFGEYGTVLKTVDRGATWEALAPIPDEIYPLTAELKNDSEWWVGGLNGLILTSKDAGQTWTREDSGTASPIYKFTLADGKLFALGEFGTIRVQSEGSTKWARDAASQSIRSYLRASAATDNGLIVGGGLGSYLRIAFDK